MQKPPLTGAQKEKFKFYFEDIIFYSPDKIRTLWNGNIEWNRDLPVFNDSIHMKLQGKSAHDYGVLIDKLSHRNL